MAHLLNYLRILMPNPQRIERNDRTVHEHEGMA